MGINSIVETLTNSGIARSNKFEISGSAFPDMELANTYVRNVSFPGFSLGTGVMMDKNDPLKYPYSVLYNELTVTFTDDESGTIYSFYKNWLNDVYDGEGFGYYSNYVRDAKVTQLTTRGGSSIGVQLYEVYPTNISEVNFSQETAEATTFTVILTYRKYETVK